MANRPDITTLQVYKTQRKQMRELHALTVEKYDKQRPYYMIDLIDDMMNVYRKHLESK